MTPPTIDVSSHDLSRAVGRAQLSGSSAQDAAPLARNPAQSPSEFDPISARVATAYPDWCDAERRYRKTFSPGQRSSQQRAVKAAATAALMAELT